ncbi:MULTISPECIES: lipid A ABC transporter ATP-binding protein/permease MsbA [Vibrio]|jgi:subfamily B ATP-binding cassette protein MsbA|uniref:Lipid ABC transporter permease/ATP-binding protein n=1 Tax=Vibrio natriegens NBRC 15636 = ATCC 14048 = DSM 759 TaxID=1219067 RepID=A0AAN1CVB4_VIBNA|nr:MULTISPECIES: lipid A ABC transporter ATP-binding protein/permease MsbA [Vibrio]MEE3878430.1 lipid A ABC transporter ATP-binding protein/permease MsbA [Vibrio sp. YYF0003]WMN88126.1 lipid A ABC transporter ATP-binding protein/permease MsbA [Vibrio parahaemolyticus]AEX21407.1 lipid transporter ATP-binding/permease protein [Vibrio sp. EJY3]ALR16027.1 lipid transporter ATP-binding/permease [Vibrio natriegens NBRC 15636 = ATCC 14048 = DSM 759]ANQ12111.1 lipid ABC transporter permease/ATP-bindin
MSINTDETTWQTFKRLWQFIRLYKAGLIVAIIALVINAVSDTYMISLLKPLLDEGFGSAESDFLRTLPLIIFAMMFIRGTSGFVSDYCLSWVSGNVVMQIRRLVFNHFMHMPVSYFDKEKTGNLLSRITYDSEQVSAATSRALVSIVREGASIIGLLTLMFYNSWQLSLVLFAVAPVVAWGIGVVSKRFRKISKNMQTMMGNVTASAEQMLKGHKVVLSYGGQDIERQRFEKVSNQMRQQSMKLVTAQAAANPIIQMIASVAIVAVLYLASIDSIKEQLTPGTFTVVFSAMFGLMRPLKALTNVTSQFQRGMAASQTLFALIDLEPEKNEGKHKVERANGDISVKDITFTYEGSEKPALEHVSFDIPRGKTVALVGRSGSGKSTIANLFNRFYDVDSGVIELDGHDIREYELRNLREQFALVSQNVHLFNDTIANNIAYATEDNFQRSDIERAAELAHAMEFVSKMEHGLDTMIGENGASLSGGQRQRIAIARALLRDAPVLILDEATSALDTESERAIQAALDELQKDKTVLVIAHRLSTIEKADEILVVDDGAIVERGNHADLISKDGAYAQLHRIQFGG